MQRRRTVEVWQRIHFLSRCGRKSMPWGGKKARRGYWVVLTYMHTVHHYEMMLFCLCEVEVNNSYCVDGLPLSIYRPWQNRFHIVRVIQLCLPSFCTFSWLTAFKTKPRPLVSQRKGNFNQDWTARTHWEAPLFSLAAKIGKGNKQKSSTAL